ncbi:hypothetical protein [Rhodovulum kholense]|uniref:Tetratricopeptide repeat protein n=1 Tax=Rhodovulum kholense TaxID=453584 RepID=A0A8E3ASD0_9RHOB|nr:hypothetical protein [Rhodovulum kholense]PTW51545.1 hypothetical protein C8N38_102339 [Rhodovulum kholense]
MRLEDRASEAFAHLANAPGARSDPEGTARAVEAALEAAPDDLNIRLGAYRFYFYAHRFAEAIPQAEAILAQTARRLNIPADWRAVGPADAAFSAPETAPGLYLQALIALAYCHMRLGDMTRGWACLDKALTLDPTDRFAAYRLVRAADPPAEEDEDDPA